MADSQPNTPQLTPWQRNWRYGVAVLSWAGSLIVESVRPTAIGWVDVLVGLLGLLVIRFRYRFPILIAVGLGLAQSVSMSVSATAVWAFLHIVIRRKPKEITVAGLAGISGVIANFAIFGDSSRIGLLISAIAALIGYAGLLAIGIIIANRREIAARKAREAELQVENAKIGERQRIAREMHDALAHRISLVSMHAAALSYREDLSPEEIRQAAKVIEENSHLALTELRGVLGSLRQDGEKPQPTLAEVPQLIQEATAAGHRVRFINAVDLAAIPVVTGRHAYRIVQEGLTNARKHSPDTTATVELAGGPGTGLTIAVSNPLGTASDIPGAGSGLAGLAERAEMTGGTISYGAAANRFDLKVWLPW